MKTITFIHKKIILLIILFYSIFSAVIAQVINYPVAPYYVGVDYINTNATLTHQGPIIAPRFPNTSVDISGTSNVVFKSGTQIELNPGFTAEPDEDGSFVAEIDPQIDYILIAPDPSTAIEDDIVHINKWEKLEIGFKLPEEYQNAVEIFFANYHPENNGLTPSTNPMLNPYADDSLNVEIILTSPTGRLITKWGFFMRVADFSLDGDPYDPDNPEKKLLDENQDDPLFPYNWRFRFAPDEIGTWTFNVTISEPYGMPGFPTYTFMGFAFICYPPLSSNHGFLKKNSSYPAGYLQFDDATPFFGIGENIADITHASSSDDFYTTTGITVNEGDGNVQKYFWYKFLKRDYNDYMSTFDEMHATGANYARILMLKSNFAVEWQNMGVYDEYDAGSRFWCPGDANLKIEDMDNGNRQYNLWAFDNLIDKAHENGIYIQLSIDPGPPMVAFQNFIWGDHAYAYYTYDLTSTPKYKTDIVKYFTDDNATHGLRYYWKRRYKYIMSRYGYSVNIAAIETFGEVDQILGYNNYIDNSTINPYPGLCEGNNMAWNKDYYPTLRTLINDWHNDILGYTKGTLMNNANKHLTMAGGYTDNATHLHTDHPEDSINTIAQQQDYYQLFYNSNIDIVDIHHYVYGKDMFSNSFNLANNFVRNTLGITNKPFHLGEFNTFGNINVNIDADAELEEVETAGLFNNYDVSFHNELWASTFMGGYTTGLTWKWNTVHWWPDANPNELKYVDNSGDEQIFPVKNGLDEWNGISPYYLDMPDGSMKQFKNRKIYHNFKPLSDYIKQSEINFNDFLYPFKVYDDNRNVECYYLVNNYQNKAYGWLHNLNMYWNNQYYYFYKDYHPVGLDANDFNFQNYNCQAPLAISGFTLNGFESYELYTVNFYRTRMDDSSPLPPVSYILSDYAGRIDFDNSILNYLGCDSVNADFGFVIAKISNLKTNGDTNSNIYSPEMNYDSLNRNIINSFTYPITENNIEFLVYPNPSDGKFKIESLNYPFNYDIIISNELGEIIFYAKEENRNTFIDISNQSKGIYNLNITGENYNNYFKIILK